MPRILFVAAHRPGRSPSQRFRFEQYFHLLAEAGFEYDYSWLIEERDDAVFYRPGNFMRKSNLFLRSWIKRFRDVLNAGRYDIIFIHREAFMTGSVMFEKMFRNSGAKIIFDFDDAIWHFDISEANRRLGWLKRPSKTKDIIGLADAVIAGNAYLAGFASSFNENVTIIPTTIDTDYHRQQPDRNWNPEQVCIGWTGSLTTVKHFRMIEPVLQTIRESYGNKVRFKLIGDPAYANESLGLRGTPWRLQTEVQDLSEIDIGIMPLPDDEWAKGKCGFKGLQYMAMEVPAVLSPVGVNTSIVEHGKSGYLADTTEEWISVLSHLIDNQEVRREIGREARQVIWDRYSVHSQWPVYRKLLEGLISG